MQTAGQHCVVENSPPKKVLRWVEHGVKVEFKKGLPFAPKPSAPKFVDPQDVDFAIQDLLKDRRIWAYQDLAPGGDQFLSKQFDIRIDDNSSK